MLLIIATNAVISKGYDGAPALKYSDENKVVRFRVGVRVYDKRTKDNYKWINLSVKAFGPVFDRIKKMRLQEGMFINFKARLDEDIWKDPTTQEQKSNLVAILDEVEYCHSNSSRLEREISNDDSSSESEVPDSPDTSSPSSNGNFIGYVPLGGANPYFDI